MISRSSSSSSSSSSSVVFPFYAKAPSSNPARNIKAVLQARQVALLCSLAVIGFHQLPSKIP